MRGLASGTLLLLYLFVATRPVQAADQGKINEAIARAAKFLQQAAGQQGYQGGSHGSGSASLVGLALLEANVPSTDASLRNIIGIVRSTAMSETKTYNISLSIVFLDRLGQAEDELAIQLLGIKLYAALSASGGWGYDCGMNLGGGGIGGGMPGAPPGMPGIPGAAPGFPGLPGAGPGFPGANPGFPAGPVGPVGGPAAAGGPGGAPPALPGGVEGNPAMPRGPGGFPAAPGGFPAAPGAGNNPPAPPQPDNGFPQPKGKGKGQSPKKDDGFPDATPPANNSNPQDQTTGRLRPEALQLYMMVRNALRGGRPGGDGDNSNTQFGLIGLWIASRHGVPANDAFSLIEARFLRSQNPANGGWGYMATDSNATGSMTCAGLLGLAVGGGRTTPPPAPKTEAPKAGSDNPFDNPKKKGGDVPDARRGFDGIRKAAVDRGLIGLGQVLRAVKAGTPLKQFVGLGDEFYLLWSIERVCMAYGLDTLGDVDWHDLGSTLLITSQGQDGAWQSTGHGGGPDVATAFAVLFLTRSNFVKDLSAKIRGQVRDPGKSELRGSNVPALFAPETKNPNAGGAGKSSEPEQPKNDPIADALVAATGPAWLDQLKKVRDTKGSDFTAALVRAIPLLDVNRKKEAREALAERLTRMTAATLRKMLNDPNPELRRGAVLACGMKEDLDHVVDLIERITDSSDLVVRATRASLKSLTSKDFGPPPNATDEVKEQAKAEWVKWFKEQQEKP